MIMDLEKYKNISCIIINIDIIANTTIMSLVVKYVVMINDNIKVGINIMRIVTSVLLIDGGISAGLWIIYL